MNAALCVLCRVRLILEFDLVGLRLALKTALPALDWCARAEITRAPALAAFAALFENRVTFRSQQLPAHATVTARPRTAHSEPLARQRSSPMPVVRPHQVPALIEMEYSRTRTGMGKQPSAPFRPAPQRLEPARCR